MLISNGYGKVINLDVETYLNMTDLEWREEIIANDFGNYIEDPFFNTFTKPSRIVEDDVDLIVIEELQKLDELNLDLDLDITEE